MLKNLQKRWKVSGFQLILILCVFAITGTTTAYVSKAITGWVGLTPESPLVWRILLRLAVLIFGYMVIILIVAFPFGQFRFFWNYEKKILRRFGLLKKDSQAKDKPISRIAIFASGAGSNAQKIIDYFRDSDTVKIALIVCNKPGAGVVTMADREKIPVLMIEKEAFFRGEAYLRELKEHQVGFLVLAGFLWKIPSRLLAAFPQRIINIHPALLPKYGGKGMFGHFVHDAVLHSGDTESGITIHYVDEIYDHGKVIFQARCPVMPGDTVATLAARIHELEHQHYPRVIEEVLQSKK